MAGKGLMYYASNIFANLAILCQYEDICNWLFRAAPLICKDHECTAVASQKHSTYKAVEDHFKWSIYQGLYCCYVCVIWTFSELNNTIKLSIYFFKKLRSTIYFHNCELSVVWKIHFGRRCKIFALRVGLIKS